ncbi:pheophytinase, chloroplastic isoform X1 [Amaranthus tricolor]|uniref:pheophytinase, chloroplastic isoform X1 n=2 Tax=Amaranthus tricolor TaxID=29722 RepID=UPI00258A46BA|nr:pheophytinase, chloroplastic isoform X1 [Amaranthus tricolor]
MSSSSSCLTSSTPSFRLKKQVFLLHSRKFSTPSRLCHPGSNNQISRRGIALRGIVAAGISAMEPASVATKPVQGLDRLTFKPEGYNFWTWRDHRIHYVVQGEGPPIVLVHGFGASAFHWRYNIPELAKKYKVYAVDLLGFGWSEKALIDYDAIIWRDQVVDFINEIVKEPAVVVGNSLGGFTALATAASLPDKVVGVVLLNSAGQFGDPNAKPDETQVEANILEKFIIKPLKDIFQRVFLGFLFWQAKQPARIESVLKSVYINSSNVDDYLVESITQPATDPKASEVYYRLMSRFMSNQRKYTLDSLLSQLSCPLLLLWGDLDPWVGPTKAIKIKEFYPNTTVVNLQAGHCPHDEVPELVNSALLEWLSSLNLEKPSLSTTVNMS